MLDTILDPGTGLRAVAALLAAKVILAVLASIKRRDFTLRYLPEFVADDVLPYGGGLTLLWLLAQWDAVLMPLYVAGAASVTGMLLAQCWGHARALWGAKPPEEDDRS